jgi:hypothetical protein
MLAKQKHQIVEGLDIATTHSEKSLKLLTAKYEGTCFQASGIGAPARFLLHFDAAK